MSVPTVTNQLVIKGWIVVSLVLGFCVSVAIPKLAIARLGEADYGIYALIVGFASILAFADMGLAPGLIRGLAGSLAVGNRSHTESVLRRVDQFVLVLFFGLTVVCTGLLYWSMPEFSVSALHALLVFALATLFVILAEIRLALLRVSGNIVRSYILRGLYLITYLIAVILFFICSENWGGIWVLCYAQLIASVVFYVAVNLSFVAILSAFTGAAESWAVLEQERQFWDEVWRVSAPERLVKVLNLIVGVVERPLLMATAGIAIVGSFDLLMRLMLLVSAIPGALSQPLLAMLAHDSVRESAAKKFPIALRLTKFVGGACALIGLIVSMVLWTYFHEVLFGLPSRIPLGVGMLVAVVAAINVMTAPGVAALQAEGIVKPINIKIYAEGIGLAVAGAAAWWMQDGLVFIAVRYSALGLSAIGFLVAESMLLKGHK